MSFSHSLQRNASILGIDHLPTLFFQPAVKHLAHYRIVFDHQHWTGWTGALIPLQNSSKPIPIDGLGQIVGCAQRIAHLFLVHDCNHDHRDLRDGWISFQLRQHRPAVHARHQYVQRNHRRMHFFGEPNSLVSTPSAYHLQALFVQKPLNKIMNRRVIIDHEHHGCSFGNLFGRKTRFFGARQDRGFRFRDDSRKPDGERGTLARLAFYRDFTTHHVAKLPANRQP